MLPKKTRRDFDKVEHLSGKINELEMFKDGRGKKCSWGRGSPAGLKAACASGRLRARLPGHGSEQGRARTRREP